MLLLLDLDPAVTDQAPQFQDVLLDECCKSIRRSRRGWRNTIVEHQPLYPIVSGGILHSDLAPEKRTP